MRHISDKEILDLLAAGERNVEQRAHLDACSECRARWEQFEKTWRLLGYWDVETVAPHLVERTLQAAARQRHRYSWRGRWWTVSRAAGIVALGAGAGFAAGRLSRLQEDPPPQSLGRTVASFDAERALYLDLFGTESVGLADLSFWEQLEPRP